MNLNDEILQNLSIIDIGNSHLKVLCSGEYKSFKYAENWIDNFAIFFSKVSKRPLRVVYASVNDLALEKILEYFSNLEGVYPFDSFELLKKQNKIKFEHIKNIGVDRLLGLVGAMEDHNPPLVTVDFGTAVTINCVDFRRFCLGGLIFPGFELQLKSLEENTSKLKKLGFSPTNAILGKNTNEAISNGVFSSIWGGISFALHRIINELFGGENIPIIFTGGGYEYFAPLVHQLPYQNSFYNKHLVLQGILALAKEEKQFLLGF
ncbi:MAG: type III pantothenate kinase [Candidatus Kapaibacteriales bacterium]